MPPQLGVDEAGKGPVFGPMTVCAVAGPEDALPEGVDDSKRLSPTRRNTLCEAIMRSRDLRTATLTVPPAVIDAPSTNMNALTVKTHAQAASAIADAGMVGWFDAADVDVDRYEQNLTDHLTVDLDVNAQHKADQESGFVAAASIVAKVARDDAMAAVAETYGTVGSGYPSDPTTQEFLATYVEEHDSLPPFARTSWKTARNALGE
jgi:ribonuclease HII